MYVVPTSRVELAYIIKLGNDTKQPSLWWVSNGSIARSIGSSHYPRPRPRWVEEAQEAARARARRVAWQRVKSELEDLEGDNELPMKNDANY